MSRWPIRTEAEYREYWIARVKARCTINERGCWIWQGLCIPYRNMKPGGRGYPATNYRTQNVRIHRKMLELKLGRPLLPKAQACHECDTPPCCNPDHLWEGNNSKNMKDAGAKGRHSRSKRTQCPHGHQFTPENTKVVFHGGGWHRQCRECNRLRGYQRYLLKKAKRLIAQQATQREGNL